MRNLFLLFMSLSFGVVAGLAEARDTKHLFPIADAMNTAAAKEKLNGGVSFYFGDQKYPRVTKNYGDDFTNKKTNAFNKTDEYACEWVFLSAMLQFQERALQLGANAVINIYSYYKKITFKSDTQYECHAGALISGVALKGTFVRLGSGAIVGDKSEVQKGDLSETQGGDISTMQLALIKKGYDPGAVDGQFGPKTKRAVKSFQSDNNLSITGKLDSSTTELLFDPTTGTREQSENNSSMGQAATLGQKENNGKSTDKNYGPNEPKKDSNTVGNENNFSEGPSSTNPEMELALWNEVKDSQNVALLQSYSERYPQGVFVDVARYKVSKLTSAEQKYPSELTD